MWWLLLILAIVAFVLGFVTVAKWLFIIAIILVLVGLFVGARGGWGRGGGYYP